MRVVRTARLSIDNNIHVRVYSMRVTMFSEVMLCHHVYKQGSHLSPGSYYTFYGCIQILTDFAIRGLLYCGYLQHLYITLCYFECYVISDTLIVHHRASCTERHADPAKRHGCSASYLHFAPCRLTLFCFDWERHGLQFFFAVIPEVQ